MTVIQQPFNLSFFAWIAFVPFVLGSLSNEKTKKTVLFAYIVGVIYWLGNLYWLFPTTPLGWIAACLYFAVYWPLVVIALRFCTERKIPLWFSVPILIVGEETLRGYLFSWRFLAHSQFSNISFIQITDIFGTAGVSFVIAMVNGLIAEIIITCKEKRKTNLIIGTSITLIIIAAVISYGRHRINQTPECTEAGPRIGIVQSNVPVKAGEDMIPFEQVFLDQLVDSRHAFIQAAPSLIIWPETMVESVLSENYLKLVADGYASKVINGYLVQHANEGVNILVGAFAADAAVDANNNIKLNTRYNTAFLYEPNQPYARQHYSKIHLVPFGEYIPLKKELPFLFKFLLSMTPYDFDYTLDAGSEYTNFKIAANGKNYNFATSICFEDTVPEVCRKLVAEDGIKQADWLVNISNDGWFVRPKGKKLKASTELSQRMAISVFRAIENRVPMVRCSNTGISCMIDSVGNIEDGYIAGTLNQKAAKRTAEAGWLVDTVKIDKRVTVFSKNRQFLPIVCAISLILSVVMSIYKKKLKNQK
ncbi:MAG: apolipoprotein N-acyltransferase [Planctomycetaceae bacterium]|nr:apolipoprotein N-acyltransferase [Planctomycetaceae bacterium]